MPSDLTRRQREEQLPSGQGVVVAVLAGRTGEAGRLWWREQGGGRASMAAAAQGQLSIWQLRGRLSTVNIWRQKIGGKIKIVLGRLQLAGRRVWGCGGGRHGPGRLGGRPGAVGGRRRGPGATLLFIRALVGLGHREFSLSPGFLQIINNPIVICANFHCCRLDFKRERHDSTPSLFAPKLSKLGCFTIVLSSYNASYKVAYPATS